MESEILGHYEAVLQHLEEQREECRRRLVELAQAIDSIKRIAHLAAGEPSPAPATTTSRPGPPAGPYKYAGISVRWAILTLAGENPGGILPKTAEVAEILNSGGINSSSKNFASNVSAVLSDMAKQKGELEATDTGNYRLTETGRAALEAIRKTAQYQNRLFSSVQ